MIKKILNKILGFFKSNKEENKEKEIEVASTLTSKSTKSELHCVNCNKDINESLKSALNQEDDTYYIWCKSCNKVNKIVNQCAINPPNSEVMIAFRLFKETGNTPSSYRDTEDGPSKRF